MRDKNLCLEEYLEFLKKEQNITATVEGRQYQISYVPVTGNTTFPIPAGQHYEVSGNNMDGVIVTVYP
ncbi:D-alanyl-D-alanine carboxypeptidase [compost metagenome]